MRAPSPSPSASRDGIRHRTRAKAPTLTHRGVPASRRASNTLARACLCARPRARPCISSMAGEYRVDPARLRGYPVKSSRRLRCIFCGYCVESALRLHSHDTGLPRFRSLARTFSIEGFLLAMPAWTGPQGPPRPSRRPEPPGHRSRARQPLNRGARALAARLVIGWDCAKMAVDP